MTVRRLLNKCLDLIFPIECLGCHKEGIWVCSKCLDQISINKDFFCPICKKEDVQGRVCQNCQAQSHLDGLLVACNYKDELLDRILHYFKYQYVAGLKESLSFLVVYYLKSQVSANHQIFSANNILIPVPLHKKRLLERGFNQSELVVEEFINEFKWKLETKVLKRKRYTATQISLGKEQRLTNIKEAFIFDNKKDIKNVILFDDVLTTGATMQECAKVLKEGGVKRVWGLVIARG